MTNSSDKAWDQAIEDLLPIARDAMEHLAQGISVFDQDLKVVVFNERAADILNLPEDILYVGATLESIFRYNAERGEYGDGDVEQMVAERVELAKRFEPHSFRRTRPNGDIIQVEGRPISKGGFVTTYTDITQQVRNEAFLKHIIDASPVGFGISTLQERRITFLNSRLAELFEMDEQEMIGFDVLNLYEHPEDREGIMEQVQREGCVKDHETHFITKTGRPFTALMTLNPTLYQGTPSVFAWIYDITSLIEAQDRQASLERELHQAQKLEAIGQLAAGIAHEINTPSQYVWDNLKFLREATQEINQLLQPTLQLIEKLSSSEEGPTSDLVRQVARMGDKIELDYLLEEIPTAIDQSIQGISDIAHIVQAMKSFSHPGGDGEKSHTDINQLLENSITVSRGEWKHVAKVEADLDNNIPHIICNPGEMGQVFLNLLVNAAHAIEAAGKADQGRIRVHTRQDDQHVYIDIGDTGVGIPDSAKDKVFEPFYTTKEVGKGTGQGLSITRHFIVNKLGGRIEFESQPGAGTVFTLTLNKDH